MAQVTSHPLDSDPGPRFDRCVDRAHALLRKAADQWGLGDPEQPPTGDVLEAILRVFEKERFLRRGRRA
ncbi:MAG: hypothetical protein HY721_01355 [Planctomycetes bacterium]|nr:hypothetical protein [Planctomycetota bacterium]